MRSEERRTNVVSSSLVAARNTLDADLHRTESFDVEVGCGDVDRVAVVALRP
jgi:hypothetical protein